MKGMRQALEKVQAKLRAGELDRFLFAAKEVDGIKIITATLQDYTADDLRKMGDLLRDKAPNCVAVLAGVNEEKITLLASCGKNAVGRGIKAGELIRGVAHICGGSGGGKPDSAMGGGKDLLKLDDALASVDNFVSEKLGK
jgi:alanyl-tRNA synthetase